MSHDDEYAELTAKEEKRKPIYEVGKEFLTELDLICGLIKQAEDKAYALMERVDTQEMVTYYADLNAITAVANKGSEIAEAIYEQAKDELGEDDETGGCD